MRCAEAGRSSGRRPGRRIGSGMAVSLSLSCVAALLAFAVLGAIRPRHPAATTLVYAACLAVSVVALLVGATALLDRAAAASVVTLPLGLPWIGAQFRVDALSAFFLV